MVVEEIIKRARRMMLVFRVNIQLNVVALEEI